MPAYDIRHGQLSDLDELVTIYNHAINQGGITADIYPYTSAQRRAWFDEHMPDQYPLYVMTYRRSAIGYCSLSPYRKGREALRQVAEISYYLHPDFRGMGLGSKLIRHVIQDAERIQKRHLIAILIDSNRRSIALLEKFNFIQWGYLPDIVRFNHHICGQVLYGLTLASGPV